MRASTPIFHIVGLLLAGLAVVMTVPALAEWLAGHDDWPAFLASAVLTLFVGGVLALATHSGELRLDLRQGFLFTTLAWIVVSAFSALPFLLSNRDLGPADAFFEAISGLTTTGATVLNGLDAMPHGILLWRSLLQWVGGLGIIAMAVAILPFLGVGGMQLFRMESSDRSDKILPRVRQLAVALGLFYFGVSVACALAYWAAGMSAFDAVNHMMTTVSTGGYSNHDASMGYFTEPAVHWVSVVFMIIGSLPFVLMVSALSGRFGPLLEDPQVRTYLKMLAVFIAAAALWLVFDGGVAPADALRLAALNIVSVITTTGYASADYGTWGSFAVFLFFVATFVGGCTGSTSGGIKIFRFAVIAVAFRNLLRGLAQPHAIVPQRYGGRALPEAVVRSVVLYVAVYVSSVLLFGLALSVLGLDFVTSLSAAATAVGNVGPGLGEVIGPAGNFSAVHDAAKWILSLAMLLGRLEFLTVLVLCLPSTWRR